MFQVKAWIPRLANPSEETSVIVIPLARSEDYVLGINFYEDVPGGRVLRLILLRDRLGLVKGTTAVTSPFILVKFDDNGLAKDLARRIRGTRYIGQRFMPFLFEPDFDLRYRDDKGVRGFLNLTNVSWEVDLRDINVQLSIQELI